MVEKYTIEIMKQIAKSRGGKCLSSKYINAKTKLRWRCNKGHEWEAKPAHIISSKTWCPNCARRKNVTIEDMQMLVKHKGGKCLSKDYQTAITKLKWQCSEGHIWWATPNNIKSGAWCPICSQMLGERTCRAFFEAIFKEKFPKKKLAWLKSSKGNMMELDGYCERLHLAFEYQGQQHYYQTTIFDKNIKSFEKRKENDKLKRKLCKEHRVTLIEVPYSVRYDGLQEFIIRECNNAGISIYKDDNKINYTKFDVYSPKPIQELREIARIREGKCLSTQYLSGKYKLKWRCSKGHEWMAAPVDIKSGTWCPYCGIEKSAVKRSLTIEEMRKIAESKKGVCLSQDYINANTKLKWMCFKGHTWEATPGNIKGGKWCPICGIENRASKFRLTIDMMKEIAGKKSGKCLSSNYTNARSKITWRCSKGHIWEATPDSIKHGSWCPYCSGHAPHTINELRQFAKKKGGDLISSFYDGVDSKLEWKCYKGHIWKAIPNSILRGSWCPYCLNMHLTIKDMQVTAKEKNGECLSKEYVNEYYKLEWKCSKGHIWKAAPNSIRCGQWCPKCGIEKSASKRKLTIEEMKQIAEDRGGKCISISYINSKTKLKWRCSRNHIWESVPSSIKSGTWCPICARKKYLEMLPRK